MINVTVTGTFPEVSSDLTGAMQTAAQILEDAVRENFAQGGRPVSWIDSYGKRNLGGPSGSLAQSLKKSSGADWAELSSDTPYSRIHQTGGTIHSKGKMEWFFLWQFHQTGDEKWKRMFLSVRKWGFINIPARPYMTLMQEDIDKLREAVGRFIIETNFKASIIQ